MCRNKKGVSHSYPTQLPTKVSVELWLISSCLEAINLVIVPKGTEVGDFYLVVLELRLI